MFSPEVAVTYNIFALIGLIIAISPTIAWVVFWPKIIKLSLQSGSVLTAVAVISGYILVPLASWYEGRRSAHAQLHEIQERVNALPVQRLEGAPPEFIVFRGNMVLRQDNLSALSCPKAHPKEGDGITYLLTPEQRAARQIEQRLTEAAEAKRPRPFRYLIIEADQNPPVPTKARPVAGGETRRLYLHSDGKETLIGVHFVPYIPMPFDVPILTLKGWYEQPNVINARNDRLDRFLRSTLHVKCIDLRVL